MCTGGPFFRKGHQWQSFHVWEGLRVELVDLTLTETRPACVPGRVSDFPGYCLIIDTDPRLPQVFTLASQSSWVRYFRVWGVTLMLSGPALV